MDNKEYYRNVLLELKEKAGEVEAIWNGKNSGSAEENAHISHEIIEHIEQITDLLDTLN